MRRREPPNGAAGCAAPTPPKCGPGAANPTHSLSGVFGCPAALVSALPGPPIMAAWSALPAGRRITKSARAVTGATVSTSHRPSRLSHRWPGYGKVKGRSPGAPVARRLGVTAPARRVVCDRDFFRETPDERQAARAGVGSWEHFPRGMWLQGLYGRDRLRLTGWEPSCEIERDQAYVPRAGYGGGR
jgi:hypothetical protein